MKNSSFARLLLTTAILLGLGAATGCNRKQGDGRWQGYFEGEFVHVASPLAGRLEKLSVTRGTRIDAGAPLFRLDAVAEQAAQREATGRLHQAQARLADLTKGQRPTELAAAEARLAQAQSAAELSGLERDRIAKLHAAGAVSDGDLDRVRLAHAANQNQVAQAEAQLATAKLGARSDSVAAAEAEVAAAQAALERADWSLAQKAAAAPQPALVHDTLFREGEFVPAGAPVVSLLPPGHLKVRFFVPESEYSALKTGDIVLITVSGREKPVEARISYLATQPEFTPPVLYNRENRSKLVFMAEAHPVDVSAAHDFHPGQPVDVKRR